MLKTQELKNMSRQELEEKALSLKKSLFEMRTERSTGHIEKPSRINVTRRDIARILTILKEKESPEYADKK